MLTLITAIWLFSGPTGYWVTIQPLDFQDPVNPGLFIEGITEMSTNGHDIFIAEKHAPNIYQIDREGKLIRAIHARGHGPGELGVKGVRALVARANGFWTLEHGNKHMHYFEDGEHQIRFSLASFLYGIPPTASHQFAFDENRLIVPAHPTTGSLAHAYSWDGRVLENVGKIWPKDLDLLRKIPAMNDTIWARDDQFWYALFPFRPFVRVFDNDLKLVREMRLQGPEIHAAEDALIHGEKPENFDHHPGHFVHFDQFGDHLYLLCRGVFYQIDKQSGETLSRVKFRGEGPSFSEIEVGQHLYMSRFCFLEDGTLVLASAVLLWDHDLWTARLPFLEKNP